MTNYVEKALANHAKGYNCAQSVVCAFTDKVGIDEGVLFKMAEGFGFGMGNMKNTCGALSGAVMLAGIVNSSGSSDNITKASTYKLASAISNEFYNNCSAFVCADIKGIETGKPIVSCNDCIKYAVCAAEKILF